MIQEDQVTEERARPETSRGHYLLEVFGILSFVLLVLLIGVELYGGMINFGDLWLVPILAVLAYLAADFLSGYVHFLADNFGSYDTPILGPNFIQPFREHHVDPKGIVGNDFVDANGNNSLASLPFMLVVWVVVPLETWYYGYLFGTFFLFVCLAAFLTNQFHKWAHIDIPPAFVGWLQERGVILSREHHDIHHESPYDTYYCITAGFWNPLLDRTRFFERAERLIRCSVPGTDPELRSEREGNLNG
ncbi:MAG: kua-ubiquitin conjugating enzyme hybrid localization domain protein [Rubrobacteraceae bacterium]|nr:kua-ubiquitin conjugating enzyme hybrid localization domain protein [Rubrobacteraceae bacterium]